MSEREYLINQYQVLPKLLGWHVADFSDADLLVRPGDHGNHAAWHLGHLTAANSSLINMVTPGAVPVVEKPFAERHSKPGSTLNEGFETKDALLARYAAINDAAIAWARSLTADQMAVKTPERLQGFAPTVGDLAYVLPTHVHMHVGQIQALRRKLGKPVLF